MPERRPYRREKELAQGASPFKGALKVEVRQVFLIPMIPAVTRNIKL